MYNVLYTCMYIRIKSREVKKPKFQKGDNKKRYWN